MLQFKHVILLTAILALSLLLSTANAEVFPGKKGFDQYGGYLSIKGKKTGRFHIQKINGRHMLVTPDGHGFIKLGVCHTIELQNKEGAKTDYFTEAFSRNWDKANQDLLKKFRGWGYNSVGYGASDETRNALPHFATSYPTGNISLWKRKAIEYPDVFSDAWKKKAKTVLEKMARRFPENHNLLGIYWTDMPAWGFKSAQWAKGQNWVQAIKALPASAPGKKRYQAFKKENGVNASDADFLVLIAREVYSHIGPLTRKLAPNTLIFGDRYSGNDLPWRVIQEALPYIDAIAVQPGDPGFPQKNFDRLYKETGKPILICDHQVSFNTPEYKNVMWKTMPNTEAVEASLSSYHEGFNTPYLLGYDRCQYIDRLKGPVLKQGLLQMDGTPYKQLSEIVTRSNWKVHAKFLTK